MKLKLHTAKENHQRSGQTWSTKTGTVLGTPPAWGGLWMLSTVCTQHVLAQKIQNIQMFPAYGKSNIPGRSVSGVPQFVDKSLWKSYGGILLFHNIPDQIHSIFSTWSSRTIPHRCHPCFYSRIQTHLISHEDGIHCFHIPSCVTSVSQWPFIACHKPCISSW